MVRVYKPGLVTPEVVPTVKVSPNPEYTGCGVNKGVEVTGAPVTDKVIGLDALPGVLVTSTRYVAVEPAGTI
jgi:hypothetical protein